MWPILRTTSSNWSNRSVPDRATLLGHDWGAHAAYGAAVLAPEMFDRIVTLAVPYGPGLREAFVTSPEQQRRSWYIFFFQSRLAEAALAYDDHALVERLWRDWSPGWTSSPDDMKAIRTAFASPGVTSAALDYYRCALGTAADAGQHAELQRGLASSQSAFPASTSTATRMDASATPWHQEWPNCFPTASTAACCPASDTSCIWSGPTT